MSDSVLIEKFIQLRVQGVSLNRISEQINVSKPTLIKWSREHSGEIENLKAVEIEHIRKKFSFTNEKNLEALLKISQRVHNELEKRDFSDLSTEKLFKLSSDVRSQVEATGPTTIKNRIGIGDCAL